MRQVSYISAAVVLLSLRTLPHAQAQSSTWNEGLADAGEAWGTQRVVSSIGFLWPNPIQGRTLYPFDGVDMIEVNWNEPWLNFTPAFPSGEWNARLYLFRGAGHGVGNPEAEPLLWIDTTVLPNNTLSLLPSFINSAANNWAMSAALASIGESFVAGQYIIAITGPNKFPTYVDAAGVVRPVFNVPWLGGLGTRAYNTTNWSWSAGIPDAHGNWAFSNQPGGFRFILPDTGREAEYVWDTAFLQVNNAGSGHTQVLNGVPCAAQFQTIFRPLWIRLFREDAHEIRISTCGVSFNSIIAAYTALPQGGPTDQLVACNNDGCGTAYGGSVVEFGSSECSGEYLVCIGTDLGSMGGTGIVRIEPVVPPPLPSASDLTGDGEVNAADLAQFIAGWSTAP